jgi:hypothetical protein
LVSVLTSAIPLNATGSFSRRQAASTMIVHFSGPRTRSEKNGSKLSALRNLRNSVTFCLTPWSGSPIGSGTTFTVAWSSNPGLSFCSTTSSSRVETWWISTSGSSRFIPDRSRQPDNGNENPQSFDAALKRDRIPHLCSYPRCPKINAYIESHNRALREEFIDNHLDLIHDNELFHQKLADYLIFHNTQRVYKGFENKKPVDYLIEQEVLSHLTFEMGIIRVAKKGAKIWS